MHTIFETISSWTMESPDYGREPRICVDSLGRYFAVWIAWRRDGEYIASSIYVPGGSWSPVFEISDVRAAVIDLAVAPYEDGVLVAWVDDGDLDNDGLKLRAVKDTGTFGDVNLVLPARRSPMGVELAAKDGQFFLVWSVRYPGGAQVEGYISDDPLAIHVPMRLSQRRRMNIKPVVAFSCGHAFVAWQYMTFRGGSRLFVRRLKNCQTLEPPFELFGNDGSTNAECALAPCADGVWIAWQSDLDPLLGPGLVRWIEVGHISQEGRFNRPAHKMRDVHRDDRGEDQGFEFPSLVVCDDGRLVVVGNGSQSLRRQDLTPQGWTARGQIDSVGWQCRGRVRATLCSEGVLVAGRDRDGIKVRLLPTGTHDETPPVALVSLSEKLDFSQSAKGVHILGRRVLFGDIHQHTAASDGTGTLEETYNRARYRYGDDIVAVSDHESFLGKKTPPGEWVRYCQVADAFYEPGEFVTLYAYEWTGAMHPGPGHKVVYPPTNRPEQLFSRDADATQTSEGLMRAAKEVGALVIPHHVGWTGADMENHDEEVSTCFEIVSCHGAYERLGVGPIGTRGDDKEGQFVGDALDRGLRFGLVGGSDGHGLNWHHGVCRMADSHRTGLTAVIADDITREGVLDALAQRRCYATSGTRIGLWFEVDGRPMGEVVHPGGIASYRVVVNGTAAITSLCLVTNRGREIALKFTGRDADVHGTLPPVAEEGVYYYVRVVQEDGHCAWSSPIFIEPYFDPIDDRLIG